MRPALAVVAALAAATASAQTSVKLTDVVRSTGIGNIDLLKDVTPAALEAFRSEAGGLLMFAVDINEAANGTEKASSQGVSLDTVVLRVTSGGQTRSYALFETDTQALLARAGSTTRQPHYTLIGDVGSSRITGNNAQAEFDAVLRVAVPDSLANATAVVLEVHFLQTNVSLGDPEAFYDFTNGFEDLALVNLADARYLTALAPGQSEAPAVVAVDTTLGDLLVDSWLSFPSTTGFVTVSYEDLFPNRGDYDFNDVVVSYRVDLGLNPDGRVARIKGTAYLIARGAGRNHDWRLRFRANGAQPTGNAVVRLTDPVSRLSTTSSSTFAGDIDLLGFADSRALLPPPPGSTFTNTEPTAPFVVGPRLDFTVNLDASVALNDLAAQPFDPYLVVRGGGYEIHLPGIQPTPGSRNAAEGLTSFLDPAGYPFAVFAPDTFSFPHERTDLGVAYPQLLSNVLSGGTSFTDWYKHPNLARVKNFDSEAWAWIPPP